MAHKRIRPTVAKQKWAKQYNVKKLAGKPLRVSVSIEQRYSTKIERLIKTMLAEVEREVLGLYSDFGMRHAFAMDASIASQARILMNALQDKFAQMFANNASDLAQDMIDQVEGNSASSLKSSLRDVAGGLTFSTDILNGPLRDILTASVAENVALIKRVPEKYLGDVNGAVMRSIQTGNGLADLRPALDKYGITIKNWAKNVAMDQTRKAYNGINLGRMEALGVKTYEWVHSGGSNKPRIYHKDKLNGTICRIDQPPVIDERTGERGIPGQLPYCRCTMRPIVSFED